MPAKALRLIGELLILAAVIIGLWLVYENVFTNSYAQQQSQVARKTLVTDWTKTPHILPKAGQPLALMFIPKLENSVWGMPIIEGVSQSDLAKGVGHYPGTGLPGQVGNFAVAGHRVTHGQPFYDFPRLQVGDSVVIETGEAWYKYQLFANKFVSPSAYEVVSNMPDVAVPAGYSPVSLITLTTCDPAWNSYRRWVWWGSLVGTYSLANPPIEAVIK